MISENYFKSAQVSDLYGHIDVADNFEMLVTDLSVSSEDFVMEIFNVSPTLSY